MSISEKMQKNFNYKTFKRVTIIPGLCLLIIALGGVAGWFVRGEYDELFMHEGVFHVVNLSNQNLDVTLEFPSGHQENMSLRANGSTDFVLHNTGEGSISVTVDQNKLGDVGYVTSMNNITVLAISPKEAVFSQIFPSLISEQNIRDRQ